MKKLTIAFITAILIIAVLAAPALACGPQSEADVELSDIDVKGELFVGQTVTASGAIIITADAETWGFLSAAYAESDASYSVVTPDSTIIASGSNYLSDFDVGLFRASADGSQVFEWTADVELTQDGDWVVSHSGEALAWAGSLLPPWCSFSECSGQYTLTFAVIYPKFTTPNALKIFLPNGSKWYWYCGRATQEDIDLTDGIVRIQIPAGTWITCPNGEAAQQLRIAEDGSVLKGIEFNCCNGGEVVISVVK